MLDASDEDHKVRANNPISEMLDWNEETTKGSDYAKVGYVIHTFFTSILVIAIEFYIGVSSRFSGSQKAVLGLFTLFVGIALVVFGRIILELFRTVFKVERQLNVLQDLGRQNRIRPNLELIESQLKEMASRNTEEILQPILVQIERHLAIPKELAQQESLLPVLERINDQIQESRFDYSRASLDATLNNIEANIENLRQQDTSQEVIATIDELKLQLLLESSEKQESILQPTLEAIRAHLEDISQKAKPKKTVQKRAKKKTVSKASKAKTPRTTPKKKKPLSKSTKKPR